MKKYLLVFFMFLISLSLVSCVETNNSQPDNKITPPKDGDISIVGTWEVTDYKTRQKEVDKHKNVVGKKAYFNNDFASFNNEYINEPNYKTKYTNIKNYLFHQYNISDFLDEDLEGDVVQITSEEKNFYEVIKLKEDKAIIYVEDTFYYLKRISKEVDVDPKEISSGTKSEFAIKGSPSTKLKDSGVFLGLKSLDEKNEFKYRTLWISQYENYFGPMYNIDNLLVPRINGFSSVKVENLLVDGAKKDTIVSSSLNSNSKKGVKVFNGYETVKRNILFVGNNYISTEVIKENEKNGVKRQYYEVIPIDNTSISQGIRLSYIEGDIGKTMFSNEVEKYIRNNPEINRDEVKIDESYFALDRRNGRWRLKGGIDSNVGWRTFDINMLPPKVMVAYDDLYIPWSYIKSRFPDAVDAYTSPNNRMIIILTKDNLYGFNVVNNEIEGEPEISLKLNPNETVVMAEWASGTYVSRWEAKAKSLGTEIK
ncbi:hypothetical protein [Clostridium hydrogeniformans]|uniref:hypothetical protein n=1 Tax=Clostridium hydrogeniformans TaxID=349933 RepID=UPI000484539D|nr:hypothetical protein [Clostridium hydrogeniformans]